MGYYDVTCLVGRGKWITRDGKRQVIPVGNLEIRTFRINASSQKQLYFLLYRKAEQEIGKPACIRDVSIKEVDINKITTGLDEFYTSYDKEFAKIEFDIKKKEQELNKRELQLKKKEQELAKREIALGLMETASTGNKRNNIQLSMFD